jgi:hypothetical protein
MVDLGDTQLEKISKLLHSWYSTHPEQLGQILMEKRFKTDPKYAQGYTLLHFCVIKAGRVLILNKVAEIF